MKIYKFLMRSKTTRGLTKIMKSTNITNIRKGGGTRCSRYSKHTLPHAWHLPLSILT